MTSFFLTFLRPLQFCVAIFFIASNLKADEPKLVPVDLEQIDTAILRGVDFLIDDQNKNGSWGSATRTKDINIYAPLPGAHDAYRAGQPVSLLAG